MFWPNAKCVSVIWPTVRRSYKIRSVLQSRPGTSGLFRFIHAIITVPVEVRVTAHDGAMQPSFHHRPVLDASFAFMTSCTVRIKPSFTRSFSGSTASSAMR